MRPYVNLSRWFDTCIRQPKFEEVLRPGKLLQPPKKAAVEGKGGKEKKTK